VDCDEYLIEDKVNFLQFIKEISEKEITSFPIIFYKKEFIGGFIETQKYLKKLELTFEETFTF
jgi:hypothetical protein